MKKPMTALLLNALVLPGMGQLYLGRKLPGFLLIMLINLLLIAALFLALKIMSPLIAANLTGTPITAALVLAAAQPYALWGKLLIAAMAGLWGYGLLDLISAFRKESSEDKT